MALSLSRGFITVEHGPHRLNQSMDESNDWSNYISQRIPVWHRLGCYKCCIEKTWKNEGIKKKKTNTLRRSSTTLNFYRIPKSRDLTGWAFFLSCPPLQCLGKDANRTINKNRLFVFISSYRRRPRESVLVNYNTREYAYTTQHVIYFSLLVYIFLPTGLWKRKTLG